MKHLKWKHRVIVVVLLSGLCLTACGAEEQNAVPETKMEKQTEAIAESTEETASEISVENKETEQVEEVVDKYLNGDLPRFETEQGVEVGGYYCGKGNYKVQFENSTYAEFKNYLEKLKEVGFDKYTGNTIGENAFATYVREEDDTVVYVSWFENKETCQIVSGPIAYLPQVEALEYESVTIPSVTQIGRAGANETAPGMSMVLQLEDGSYVVIDGGPSNASDQKDLLDFLVTNNPNEGKPVVTWMFTHAHSDHISLAMNFLAKYYEEIELKLVCYNFVDFETASVPKEQAGLSMCAEYEKTLTNVVSKRYPDAEIYIFHGGEKLLLPGCEIEFLLTHEEHWPNPTPWYNYTSSAWRMTIEDKTLIILGDCDITCSRWMAEVYGEELKSEMLQLSHHGFNGASKELYQYIDPDICFWPVNETRYLKDERCLGTKAGYEFNAWLRDDSVKVRQHYAASETVTLLYPDLTIQ